MDCKLVLKATTCSLEVNGQTYRWSKKSEVCEWFRLGEKETIEHLIIVCEGHEYERQKFIYEVIDWILYVEWSENNDHGISIMPSFDCCNEFLNMYKSSGD